MGKGGYSKKEQPVKGAPVATVGGGAISGNPYEFIEGEALHSVEHPDNGKSMGDNPSMPVNVPFANGKDKRNR